MSTDPTVSGLSGLKAQLNEAWASFRSVRSEESPWHSCRLSGSRRPPTPPPPGAAQKLLRKLFFPIPPGSWAHTFLSIRDFRAGADALMRASGRAGPLPRDPFFNLHNARTFVADPGSPALIALVEEMRHGGNLKDTVSVSEKELAEGREPQHQQVIPSHYKAGRA